MFRSVRLTPFCDLLPFACPSCPGKCGFRVTIYYVAGINKLLQTFHPVICWRVFKSYYYYYYSMTKAFVLISFKNTEQAQQFASYAVDLFGNDLVYIDWVHKSVRIDEISNTSPEMDKVIVSILEQF